ncbi:MAG: cupin domain-containing protein, partial [Alphaproteobacteria bacterium]|nr:cupin domain-containing protein [Alphaproteobacteria bacterium]
TVAQAQERPAEVTVRTLLSTQATATGQPIVLPPRDVQLIVSEFVIAPGATLPVHRHPFPRYGIVMEGTLRVARPGHKETFEYKSGDVVVEMVGELHFGTNTGTTPVRLIVIDQVVAGSPHTVLEGR